MDFSDALMAMKAGHRITNHNWNGPDQFVFMQKGYPSGVPANKNTAEAAEIEEGELITVSPYLMLKNAQDEFVPWVPSQGDLFSEAWEYY